MPKGIKQKSFFYATESTMDNRLKPSPGNIIPATLLAGTFYFGMIKLGIKNKHTALISVAVGIGVYIIASKLWMESNTSNNNGFGSGFNQLLNSGIQDIMNAGTQGYAVIYNKKGGMFLLKIKTVGKIGDTVNDGYWSFDVWKLTAGKLSADKQSYSLTQKDLVTTASKPSVFLSENDSDSKYDKITGSLGLYSDPNEKLNTVPLKIIG